jgi:putative holliday junction resolvase
VARDHEALARIVAEEGAERVVIGLPLSLRGEIGTAARAALDEAAALGQVLAVPVETFDERLTTVSAHRSLQDQKITGPARRRIVDKVAAAVMLQGWLERGRR